MTINLRGGNWRQPCSTEADTNLGQATVGAVRKPNEHILAKEARKG